MFRILTVTTLFALGLTTAAQADSSPSLNGLIQKAAENHCAPLLGSGHTSILYKKWYADCVTSSSATITARVAASTPTSTALLTK